MESLIEAFICRLNSKHASSSSNGTELYLTNRNRHFLENPKILPCCRQIACNKCVIKHARTSSGSRKISSSSSSSEYETCLFNCPFCNNKFKFSISNNECDLESDEMASREYDRNLIEINHYLVKKLDGSMKNIEDRLASKDTSLKKRREFIKNEIHVQMETIRNHLVQLEQEMLDNLDASCKNIEVSLSKFEDMYRGELSEKKTLIENLKSNAFSYAYGLQADSEKKHKMNLVNQQQSVEKCIQSLNDLNSLNVSINEMIGELRFDPNIDLPDKSIIGKLKKVREINLVDIFKNIKLDSQINRIASIAGSSQLMPISPRYLAITDPTSLCFTDSQTKQLIMLKLDTGDFVRSSSQGGQFKNPDGICVNPKTGHVYVSDNEQKVIFKLDSQLTLIKKFGSKELKWPRGMFYDAESGKEESNPNCLYVCDYSNQRIAIFNGHDQLRDYLTIPMNSNDPVNGKEKGRGKENYKKYEKQILIDEEIKFCPLNVVVTKNHIYATDDWTGGNCIRVFDKKTHSLLRNVGHLNVWDPSSLIVDDLGNLFTIGRLYYETGATHLFCYNKEGELLYKSDLKINSEPITDMVLDRYTDRSNFKLICCGEKRLYIYEF